MTGGEAQSRLNALREQVEHEAQIRASLGSNPDWAYNSHQEIVIKHGACRAAPLTLPAGYRLMEAQRCFGNALELVAEDNNLFFCEGWATFGRLPYSIQHAWVEDEAGVLIDPTWQSRIESDTAYYFGVRFSSHLALKRAIASRYPGILSNDYMLDYQALKHGFVIEDGVIVDDVSEPKQRWRSHERVR